MMRTAAVITAFFLASLAALASASITILYPSSQYYLVEGQQANVLWNVTDPATDPKTFTIELKVPALGPLALANNVNATAGNKTVLINAGFVNTGFILNFVAVNNISQVISVSEPFEIKPNGTALTTYTAPSPTATPTTSISTTASTSPTSTTKSVGAVLTAPTRLQNAGILGLAMLAWFMLTL